MIEYTHKAQARSQIAWAFFARPGLWHHWAPHVRGAWGLGEPEVRPYSRGVVRLAGIVPVPAQITTKRPGVSWSWKVGPYEMEHRVKPIGERACELALSVDAPGPLERAFALTYGRTIEPLLGRLASVSEELERETPSEEIPLRRVAA